MLQKFSNSSLWRVVLVSLFATVLVGCNSLGPEMEANLGDLTSEELATAAFAAGDCPSSESVCGLIAEVVCPTCPPDYPYKNPGEFRACVAQALAEAIKDLGLQGCVNNGERQALSGCVEARIFASLDTPPGSRKLSFEETAGR